VKQFEIEGEQKNNPAPQNERGNFVKKSIRRRGKNFVNSW